MPRFQPEEILRALERHRVEYVLIGGLAATLHGSPLRTGDADICPSRGRANLERLAAALRDVDARVRTAVLNLSTRYGDLDLSFEPAGTSGYDDLRRQAVRYALDDVVAPVASLEDVIRSKQAANRAKDREALPTLHALLAQRVKRTP